MNETARSRKRGPKPINFRKMAREEDENEPDEIDPEGPDPHEMDYSDEPDLAVCPHCRRMISEEAEICPHCGEFISPADAPMSKPAWIVITAIILLLVGLLWWAM
jgi:hypothetical protein